MTSTYGDERLRGERFKRFREEGVRRMAMEAVG
jgi:hypothetical protein